MYSYTILPQYPTHSYNLRRNTMSMYSCDNRKSSRFYGEIPIEFKNGVGTTRDYSADGVFFTTDQPVALGEQIEFFMVLRYLGTHQPVRVQCEAQVVRIEPGASWTGAAAVINSHSIEMARN